MQDTTHATVTHWTEYRTPSGRWSKVRHDETEEDFKPHNLQFFFDAKFPGERRVYHFSYYTGPREVVTYTYED